MAIPTHDGNKMRRQRDKDDEVKDDDDGNKDVTEIMTRGR